MPKKVKRSTLIKKLDSLFSRYVRQSKSKDGYTTCATCGKIEEWKNQDCGHFISRIHMSTRWDERNVAPQCKYCNRYCQGQQYLFSQYLGDKLAEELYIESKKIRKFDDVELQDMIAHYTELNKLF